MTLTSSMARMGARVILTIVAFQLAFGTQLAVAQSGPVTPVPADTRTSLTKSANGTPVLNIAAPNSAGVSHNRFTSYNVGTGGLILNNSAANAVSVIGGGTVGNGNLAGGPAASLILNEVMAPNSGSLLAGYQEILGPAAELVIANPWGVTCNGCGFVNTPRVTLTTGVPTLSPSGSLNGFTITGGQIAIGADGLDATRQSVLDLLARSISVGGNVLVGSQKNGISGDLQLLAGANRFDYGTRLGTAIAGTGTAAPFAIDSSLLGGMYADRIRLLVTEQGAGVRLAGSLAALADDLVINADGRIELRGAASAGRDFTVSGGDVQVQLADSNTYLYGGRDLSLSAAGNLELDTGSIGAARNVSFTTAGDLNDLGGVNDLRFVNATGMLNANVAGALNASGGYWTAPEMAFDAASIKLGANSTLYASGSSGTALSLTTPGTLSIAGGKVYSNADESLAAQSLQIDTAGTFAAKGALSAAASTLSNDGTIAGDTIAITTTDAKNTNAIQATTGLDLRSTTLENIGKNAAIVGSTVASGAATIAADTVTNSGTIWSAGDLALTPTKLVQQRAADATANPLIGAGRDLTIAYTGAADLGSGDLQAGRDLTVTGSSVNDRGSTGAGGTTGDLRFAGRNLVATAAPGGSIVIGGGQWYSKGDLRLTGDFVAAGYTVDPNNGTVAYVPGVQIVGAQGGSGTVAFTSRTGGLGFLSDASAFSGADLTVTQPQSLSIGQSTVLQAAGTLSLGAGGQINNYGTLIGGTVSLESTTPTALFYDNRPTGILYGSKAIHIGTTASPAAGVFVEAAAGSAQAGVFGGVLDINAGMLTNNGMIQASGPGSVINVGYLGNNAGAQILGFTDANGAGGLTITTPTILNYGQLYDSSSLTINAQNINNTATGVLSSAGLLKIAAGAVGAFPVYNQGQIWANTLDLTFGNGLVNGADPGVPANRGIPGSIFASGNGTIRILNGSTLTNFGTIETQGDLQLLYVGAGSGSLLNQMSMVPDSELVWITDNGSAQFQIGDLGLLTVGANGSTNKKDFSLSNTTYYFFDKIGGSTQAYLDGIQTNVQNQTLNVPASSIPTPTIRSGGNLQILGFENVLNNGAIDGAGDVTIQSASPTSTVQNTSLQFGQRDLITSTTDQYTCRFDTGVTNLATSCAASPNNVSFDKVYQQTTAVTAVRPGFSAFTGKILAGGNLTVTGGTVTNSGNPGAFTVTLPGAGLPSGTISVAPAGTPNARGGATTLNINGAQIGLPTTGNGRFVTSLASSTAPLVETNPLFGIDSLALGSDYLAKLLGLSPDMQLRRLGDSSYEDYLIQQQIAAQTGQGVLSSYGYAGAMDKALFDNAASEAKELNLGYGKALTADQVASLKSDIVWMVEQEVQGQKVLVPVVYLTDATRAASSVGAGPTLAGYNVNINGGTVRNIGGDIVGANAVKINSTGNIENLSGRVAGWNVVLNAGGDIVNSTLVDRLGDATNGIDVARRTASIEAGNTAILKAGHDVTVNGAWVSAAKDAALIAGNNVNVQSFALTTNKHSQSGDNETTSQTQVAQGGGIVAGGNAVIQAGNDVNIKGAQISAGDTAAVRAERGNVNVGVLELTNSSSSSHTSTSLYAEGNADKASTSASVGFGVEKKTTTNSTSTTTGVGSALSGNQVVVSTGHGDVNINGSSIDAGTGGLFIDSAGNLNITAYQNKTQTTDTTDTTRVGVQAEANADGAYYGTKESGDRKSTTTTQTNAQTSSLKSKGDLVLSSKGMLTNEGTQLDAAGDLVLQAKDIVNKAAQDTYSTTTTDTQWETKQQAGLTTNGTGQSIADAAQGKGDQVNVGNPELQQRVTANYSTDTKTDTASEAHGTQINAGGNVVVLAKNEASDEGTQYSAGKNIVISAADYENKAAANVTSSTDESTSVSGQATVGVDTTASVNVTASAQGSHQTSGTSESKAQVGAIKAGGAVIIEAKTGDVTLEGTKVSGVQGVGISAARDININQANDTTTSSSSEQSGSAHASVSVSLVGAGGAVGAGTSTRLAHSNDSTSTAKAASISSGSGDIQLTAGRDLTSQGANIAAAGDVALKAKRDVNLLAATDKTDKTGSVDAGGADVNVGFGTGAAKGTGSLGVNANFERGRTDYHETTEHGSSIQAGGKFSVDAGGNARLQGTQVDAATASLKTGGNLTLESAQHTVQDNSYDVSGNVGLTASKGGGTGGASAVGHGTGGTSSGGQGGNAAGGNAQVGYSKSKQDIVTNTNATINTRGGTSVDVGGDLALKGANINAQGGVTGHVDGNLTVETRTDKANIDQTNVTAYAGVGPVGGSGGGSGRQRVQEGIQTGANHVAQDGVYANVDSHQRDDVTVGTKSGISGGAGGIDLRVGGNTTLKGANNTGTDFKTQGQTTIEGVETHTRDSDTSFKITGTVASAAGSKDGSGGNFGLAIHDPHGAAPGKGPTQPSENENGRVTPAPHEATNAPRGPIEHENQPNLHPGAVPALPAEGPVVRRQPGVVDHPEAPGSNAPAARPNDIRVAHAMPPEGPLPESGPNGPDAPAQPYAPVRIAPTEHVPGSQPTGNHDYYQTETGPHQPSVVVGEGGNQYQRLHPGQNARVGGESAPPAQSFEARLGESIHNLVNTDERAKQLERRAAGLPAAERTNFNRNLAEIIAFTNLPGHEQERGPLFDALEHSLAGPHDRGDGLTEFPLRPQYVGEDVPGFANWRWRSAGDLPGDRYQRQAHTAPVPYMTAAQQEQHRVYVGEHGELTFAGGRVPDGEWIFVVDKDGHLVADQFALGVLHHSTLSGGAPVLMAGEIKIEGGRLTQIRNTSGHFRPDTESFKRLLVALRDQGVDLTGAKAPAYEFEGVEGAGGGKVAFKTVVENLLHENDVLHGRPNHMLADLKLTEQARAHAAEVAQHSAQPPAANGDAYVRGGHAYEIANLSRPANPNASDHHEVAAPYVSVREHESNQAAVHQAAEPPAPNPYANHVRHDLGPHAEQPAAHDQPPAADPYANHVRDNLGPHPEQPVAGDNPPAANDYGNQVRDDLGHHAEQPAAHEQPPAANPYANHARDDLGLHPEQPAAHDQPPAGNDYGNQSRDDLGRHPDEHLHVDGLPADDVPVEHVPVEHPHGDQPVQHQGAEQPPAEAPVAPAAQDKHEWTEQTTRVVGALLNTTGDVRTLRNMGDRLQPNDRPFFERNLAEIVSFTSQSQGAPHRQELLAEVKKSLAGPTDRGDGVIEYPVLPQLVGEEVRGFDNWYVRRKKLREKDVPGSQYLPGADASLIQPVQYFNAAQREQLRVSADNGVLTRNGEKLIACRCIFVVDEQGHLIIDTPMEGVVHHSSLSGGKPVLMAGEIETDLRGNIIGISNASGHFRPGAEQFNHFLYELHAQGVDLSHATAHVFKLKTDVDGRFIGVSEPRNLAEWPADLGPGRGTQLAPLGERQVEQPGHPGEVAEPPVTWKRPPRFGPFGRTAAWDARCDDFELAA